MIYKSKLLSEISLFESDTISDFHLFLPLDCFFLILSCNILIVMLRGGIQLSPCELVIIDYLNVGQRG